MNKLIAKILVIIMCFSVFQPMAAIAQDERRPLSNTIYRLENNMDLTIGYLGGSLTLGSGSSDGNTKSWRALTTKWFKETYPESNITEINAAIGGFGSIPDVFRMKSHLLSGKPDLVFVETAVNDYGGNETEIRKSVEGIVRQVYEYNPKADIVFVYTTNKKAANESYAVNDVMKTVKINEEIAAHYGIPSVNIGLDLYNAIKGGELTWETALVADEVHATDAGYAVYARSVINFFKSALLETGEEIEYKMPNKLVSDCYDKADIIDSWESDQVVSSGFDKSETSMGGRHPHMITGNKKDSTIDVKFKGTSVGLYWMKAPDAGMVEYWIDDGAKSTISGCDSTSATGASRGTYNMLVSNLSNDNHTLHLRVTGENGTGSNGTWLRIGGFFVSGRADSNYAIKAQTSQSTTPATTQPSTGVVDDTNKFVSKYSALFNAIGLKFNPESAGKVSRADAVIAIASLLGLNDKYTDEQFYADVKADHKAFNAVNVLGGLSIIGGKGGNFNPDNAITMAEACKMLVSAAGYELMIKEKGGYPAGSNMLAVQLGILKGVPAGSEVTADVFETMLYNTLNADIAIPNKYGDSVGYTITQDYSVLNHIHKVYEDKAVVNATEISNLGGYEKAGKNQATIGNLTLNDKFDVHKLLGYNVKYFYKVEDDERTLLFAEEYNNDVMVLASDDIRDFKDNTYIYTSDSDNEEELDVLISADVIYNGKKIQRTASIMKPTNGNVEFVDNNKDGDYDVIKITNYKNVVVSNVSTAKKMIYNAIVPGEKIELIEGKYQIKTTVGLDVYLSDIKKDDVLSLAISDDGEYTYGILSRTYIKGVATQKYEEGDKQYIEVDNILYQLSKDYLGYDSISLNNVVTFYLDYNEKIVYCAKNTLATQNYAYLIGSGSKKTTFDEVAQIKILDTNGEVKVLSVKDKSYVNNVECRSSVAFSVALAGYKGVINYSLDSEQNVTRLYTAASTASSLDTGIYSDNIAGTSLYYRSSIKNFGGKIALSSDAIVFVIPADGNEENYYISGDSIFKNAASPTVAGYKTDKKSLTSNFIVYYEKDDENFSRLSPIVLVEKKTKAVNDKGDMIEIIYGNSAGNSVIYKTDREGLFADIVPGDVIRLNTNTKDIVVKKEFLYTKTPNITTTKVGSTFSSDPWIVKGTIYKVDGNIYQLYTGSTISEHGVADIQTLNFYSGKPIIKYDSKKSSNRISAITQYELQDYVTSGDDANVVLTIMSAGVMTWMIVLE